MTLANRITIFRIVLIPVFVTLLLLYTPDREWARLAALVVFAIAALSDGVDGYIARHYNQKSNLGVLLDPLADKLLVNLAFIFMAANRHLDTPVPWWVPGLIILRDLYIAGGAYLIKWRYGRVEVQPRMLGKFSTFVQAVVVVAILANFPYAWELLLVLLGLMLATMVDYGVQGVAQVRKLRQA